MVTSMDQKEREVAINFLLPDNLVVGMGTS